MFILRLILLLNFVQYFDCFYENPPHGLLLNEIRIDSVLPFLELKTNDEYGSAGKDLSGYGVMVLEFNLRAVKR